mmetsp:Transcript_22504/g.19990  ORF Transcript_22504/g.19990 Transcript_22504/m.19990 type:complete len:261 (+) Transcript_22504:257-1039(+)
MEETAVLYQPPNSNIRNLYFFRNLTERDIFIDCPEEFSNPKLFPSDIPEWIEPHNAAQIISKEKNLANYCPVTLFEEDKVDKGYQLYLAFYKEHKFIFDTPGKLIRFLANPVRYSKVILPVKIPILMKRLSLMSFAELEDSVPFLEQSIGSIATRGLLEVTNYRMKYPTLSVKETALKLFALFLKANNPSNTEYSRKKYQKKIKTFVERCNLPLKIAKMSNKDKRKEVEEKHYHEMGAKYDKIMMIIDQEKSENFINYIR